MGSNNSECGFRLLDLTIFRKKDVSYDDFETSISTVRHIIGLFRRSYTGRNFFLTTKEEILLSTSCAINKK